MTAPYQNLVHVYDHSTIEKRLMGRLLMKNRKIFFEYDDAFIKTGLELSPFKLPLKSGIIESKDRCFEGLFDIFNDSLPDGWGRLLLDRKLMNAGLNLITLPPLYPFNFKRRIWKQEPRIQRVLKYMRNLRSRCFQKPAF